MRMTPTILLFGKDGQVGSALVQHLLQLGNVVAVGRAECDLGSEAQIRTLVNRCQPTVIVNAAAYTAVDRAESDAARAESINAAAVGVLAQLAHASGALLVHYSTDYVYAGDKAEPYVETDVAEPCSVYGRTKLAGDRLVEAYCPRHLIFRTSWVFGVQGQSFLTKILHLLCSRAALRVVCDQHGAPTSAALIGEVTARAIAHYFSRESDAAFPWGTYHLTAAGSTTWHAYAQRIARVAHALGESDALNPDAISAIRTADYPLPAKRPANSRLDTSKLERAFGVELPPWQRDVDAVIRQILSDSRSEF